MVNKKVLIEKIKPYLKDYSLGFCFGDSGSFDIRKGYNILSCQCSGKDRKEHNRKQRISLQARIKMCKIISKLVGKGVHILFGTYRDIYFVDKNGKEILGIDYKGDEIKESRSYL